MIPSETEECYLFYMMFIFFVEDKLLIKEKT